MRSTVAVALYAIFAAILGLVSSLWAKMEAHAAVEVRPALADVGFIDAALTSHGHDWLFLHYPTATTVVIVVIAAIIGAVGGFLAHE